MIVITFGQSLHLFSKDSLYLLVTKASDGSWDLGHHLCAATMQLIPAAERQCSFMQPANDTHSSGFSLFLCVCMLLNNKLYIL